MTPGGGTQLQTIDISVYTKTYTISLYDAATGKLMASQTVNGSNQNICPYSVITTNGAVDNPGPWSTILSIGDIESVIGTYAGT